IGNLYYSNYEEGRWNPAVKLGENISTKYWESHACFSRDGKILYFTSNRKGTLGGLDIYRSERQLDGKWGEPTNLGSTINSRYNEETPFITEDGQTLYFSSYGHFNMGGYDVFFSRKNPDGTWGEPINLGYPINTTDDDLHFQPVNNGYGAYYSIYSNVGRGEHDIYFMDIYSVDNPRMYFVTGNLRTADGSIDSTRIAIFVVDSQTGDTIMYTSPDQETGEFALNLRQGIYELHFSGEGYEDLIRPLRITRGSDKEGIKLDDNIELALVKKEPLIFVGEESQIGLRDTLYKGDAGETLEVPVRLQKGSTLITRVYQDSLLVSVDTIEVDRRRTTLEIDPLPGDSHVELEMIDADGNIHRHSFDVVGEVPEAAGEVPEVEPEDRKDTEPIEGPDSDVVKTIAMAHPDPVGKMLLQLQQDSDGGLNEFIANLDPDKEGITSLMELFEHIYQQAESEGYNQEEVDALLGVAVAQSDTESKGDTELLKQRLIENSDGPLKEYLESLDLDAEGIHTPEDLIRHLEEVAESSGFTLDEVREAMIRSLDEPLEVDQIYSDLLESAEGPIRKILEDMDLRKEGIYRVEELISTLYDELEAMGYSSREIRRMLSDRFDPNTDFIKKQGKRGLPVSVIILFGAGLIILIILLWRRRNRKEKSTE
ncbi:MAG: PD40 domain-containing protein, partial [Bacteroidales bacterium]|nr:PD40 domain-containing protein [Bacteroidales bacterium]